jgi:hypothetical protein
MQCGGFKTHFRDICEIYVISLPTSHLVSWTKSAKQKLGDLDVLAQGKEKANKSLSILQTTSKISCCSASGD